MYKIWYNAESFDGLNYSVMENWCDDDTSDTVPTVDECRKHIADMFYPEDEIRGYFFSGDEFHRWTVNITNEEDDTDITYEIYFDAEDYADVIIRNAKSWDEEGVPETLALLCSQAGRELHDLIHDGKDCSEIFDLLRSSSGEFLDDTPDHSEDEEDVIDWLRNGAEQAEPIHLCHALEAILNVELV